MLNWQNNSATHDMAMIPDLARAAPTFRRGLTFDAKEVRTAAATEISANMFNVQSAVCIIIFLYPAAGLLAPSDAHSSAL